MIDIGWLVAQVLVGAVGAVARYLVTQFVPAGRVSWGLVTVNMVGSTIVGAAVGAFSVGILGWPQTATVLAFAAGFTTFSGVALAGAERANRGDITRGLIVVSGHVVVGALFTGLGYISAVAIVGA